MPLVPALAAADDVARRADIARRAAPSSILPQIEDRRKRKGQLSAWPAAVRPVSSVSADLKAPLIEIEQFLKSELQHLDAASVPSEVRLEAHAQAFDLFIRHFAAYAHARSSPQHA